MVWPLACCWVISRWVKNDSSTGATAVIASSPGWLAAFLRPGRTARGWRAGTSYSDLGITGITPILGLFRYLLPCARDGPATWDDVLPRLLIVGIIRCVICAGGVSFPGVVCSCGRAAVLVRAAGSPHGKGQCHGIDGVRAG